MDKPNIFKSSRFSMDAQDVLHILIKDLTGTGVTIALSSDTDGIETEEDSEVIGSPTTTLAPSPLKDKDGNEYTSVQIGSQEWIVENYRTTKYADGTSIVKLEEDADGEVYDFFLPSLLELQKIYENLYLFGLADLDTRAYASSTENDATTYYIIDFSDGSQSTYLKNGGIAFIPCRKFIDFNGVYSIRDIVNYGWLDEYVFYISDNGDGTSTYYVVPNSGTGAGGLWSNIDNLLIGTTSNALGEGCNNTQEIVNQVGCIEGIAYYCANNYSRDVLGWIDDTTGAYCWYNNDVLNKSTYGALYNWYAVNNLSGLAYLERDGVEEAGWRVPTKEDYEALSTYLGGDAVSGGKLKEIGTTHWHAPNVGATDVFDFRGLPSGDRTYDTGSFGWLTYYNFTWASTEFDASQSYYMALLYTDANFHLSNNGYKKMGFAVRLVKDV